MTDLWPLVAFKESLVNFPSLPFPDPCLSFTIFDWTKLHTYQLTDHSCSIMIHDTCTCCYNCKLKLPFRFIKPLQYCRGRALCWYSANGRDRERKTLDHAVSCWPRQYLLCCRGERLKYLLLRGLKTMEILVSSVMTSGEWVKCQRRSVNTEIVFMDCYCLLPKSGDKRRQAVDTPW